MKTSVVSMKMRPSGFIYIGRAGKGNSGLFGNPVVIGQICKICSKVHASGSSTLACYKKYFLERLEKDFSFRQEVLALKGKRLACFCVSQEWKPGDHGPLVCHGQVMAEWIDSQR